MSDAPPTALEPIVPPRVGHWQVGPMLACGGMGMVFLVQHEAIPSRRGVLKVMRPAGVNSPEDPEVRKERFHREAVVLSKLRHRGCPQLLDFGHGADGMPYMVQEHVVGDTLIDTLRRVGALSPAVACRIIDELADVLLAARRLGIAHRDVKPENVVLAEDGAVLVDWGIALDEGASRLTQADIGPCTLAYVGPEEFSEEPADPTKREVYALGVLLVECLTGESAFPETPGAMVGRKLRIPYLEAPEGCSPALVEAIHGATRKDPAERVDLEGLRKLLAPELVGLPSAVVLAPRELVPPGGVVPWTVVSVSAPPPPRRSRTPAVVGGITVLSVALWLGLRVFGNDDTPAPAPMRATPPVAAQVTPVVDPPPPVAPIEAPPPAAAKSTPSSTAKADAPTDACTGGVTLPDGKWRLRPRGSEDLLRASQATPCGGYKLMEWNVSTNAWDARKSLVVRKDRELVCDERLRCAVAKR
ncbi:MAG: serine/threonine-protein kinase [Pseudomonadota bacterium]|nr:serine/threonine-protein kinase [Pseudomonadota bacterium]